MGLAHSIGDKFNEFSSLILPLPFGRRLASRRPGSSPHVGEIQCVALQTDASALEIKFVRHAGLEGCAIIVFVWPARSVLNRSGRSVQPISEIDYRLRHKTGQVSAPPRLDDRLSQQGHDIPLPEDGEAALLEIPA